MQKKMTDRVAEGLILVAATSGGLFAGLALLVRVAGWLFTWRGRVGSP